MKTMKVFAAMFVAATMFAFTSCSKDYENDIIGSWKAISMTYTETYQGQSHTETQTPDGLNILTFNSDHTYQASTDGHVEDSGTWSIDGDKLTLNSVGNDSQNFTIDIDGSDMTLTANMNFGSEGSYKVVVKLKKV